MSTRARVSNAGLIGFLADAAINRYLLVKRGSDDDHAAVIAAASDIPFGVTADGADAAEGDLALGILGKGETKRMVIATGGDTVAAGELAVSNGDGYVVKHPADGGTYVVVGRFLEAGDATQVVQVADCKPYLSNGIEALTVAAQRIVGRITGGVEAALTGEQVRTITDPVTWTATAVAADTLAIPITHRTVNKTTGADAEALTLADGAFLGQRLNINLVVDGGGTGTLTPTTASGFTSIIFADAGDFAELEWTTAGWRIVAIGNSLGTGDGSRIIAAGIHTWAGGAAPTDSITVAGMTANDVPVVSLVAANATETLVTAAPGTGAIAVTLSANGADGVTKLAYTVIRTHA